MKHSSLSRPGFCVLYRACKALLLRRPPHPRARSTRHDKPRETNNALCSNAFYVSLSLAPWSMVCHAIQSIPRVCFSKLRVALMRSRAQIISCKIPFYVSKKNVTTVSFETNSRAARCGIFVISRPYYSVAVYYRFISLSSFEGKRIMQANKLFCVN